MSEAQREVIPVGGTSTAPPKRQCRFPGCTKAIKSQGVCQSHGAKVKRCKVEGCAKEAKSNKDGMCKRHFSSSKRPVPPEPERPPPPTVPSVYKDILPFSFKWNGSKSKSNGPDGVMPLVSYLSLYKLMEPAWHRNQERFACGIHPVAKSSAHFESWERQLVMVEAMLLSGITKAHGCHQNLAHAWGRPRGFHKTLVAQFFDREGDVARKTRSDAGTAAAANDGDV